MALEERKKLHEKVTSGSINFQKKSKIFFFNGQLHRVIKSNAPANIIHCLNYDTKEVVKYTYSDYKIFKKRAYIMSEVSSLVRRSKDRIFVAINNGDVKSSQFFLSLYITPPRLPKLAKMGVSGCRNLR
jgi:hypothetical protein